MEETVIRLGSSGSASVVWNLLAAITVAILLVCLVCLRCCLLRRYRLGSLLILRWICLADLSFVLHRVAFLLLNAVLPAPVSTAPPGSKLLITWTCKLYPALESLLMLVQTWLLVLLAMERAAVKLRPHIGLRYFSRLRLRVGVAIAGILAFSLHINYIYVFAPVARNGITDLTPHTSRETNTSTMPLLMTTLVPDLEPSMHRGSDNVSNQPAGYPLTCSIDFGFEVFYSYARLADILLGVYLPVLIVNICVVLMCLHCAAYGFTQLSSQQAARLLPPGTAGDPRAVACLARFNNTVDLLFLVLSICCYLPLESIGIYKAIIVHDPSQPQLLYELLHSMFLPAKNLLDALVIGTVLIYLLFVARLSCPASPKPPPRPQLGDHSNVRGDESVDIGGCSSGRLTREPIELEELNPMGHLV